MYCCASDLMAAFPCCCLWVQNHAMIFCLGEAVQVIDMNQDNRLAEALKMRSVLQVGVGRLWWSGGLFLVGDLCSSVLGTGHSEAPAKRAWYSLWSLVSDGIQFPASVCSVALCRSWRRLVPCMPSATSC
jgi:hypothetical protein